MTKPKADRWYQHLPPATAVVPCEGEDHRVTWRWGKFKLDDHDLGSERAMLVLGGEPAPCLRALQFWANQFGMAPEQFEQMQQWLGESAVLAPKEFDLPREVGMALSWERAWRRSRYLDKQGRLLARQLKLKALPPLRAHLTHAKQRFGSRIIRTVDLRHVAAGRPVTISGRLDSVSVSATVTLSSDWIVRVWAPGLALVDGDFVLEVTGPGSSPGSLAVRAVEWVRHPSGGVEPVAREKEVVPVAGVAGAPGEPSRAWRFAEAAPGH